MLNKAWHPDVGKSTNPRGNLVKSNLENSGPISRLYNGIAPSPSPFPTIAFCQKPCRTIVLFGLLLQNEALVVFAKLGVTEYQDLLVVSKWNVNGSLPLSMFLRSDPCQTKTTNCLKLLTFDPFGIFFFLETASFFPRLFLSDPGPIIVYACQ